jgi:hypothetical protein
VVGKYTERQEAKQQVETVKLQASEHRPAPSDSIFRQTNLWIKIALIDQSAHECRTPQDYEGKALDGTLPKCGDPREEFQERKPTCKGYDEVPDGLRKYEVKTYGEH